MAAMLRSTKSSSCISRSNFLAAVLGASLVFGMAAGAGAALAAQPGTARHSMEQCVSRILSRLASSRASESQVGSVVLAQCDKQLRATLAAAISSGEAGFCTVETCMGLARDRAAAEAAAAYRRFSVR
jgi:hypothetical protein